MIGRAVAAGVNGPQVERLLADLAFESGNYAEAWPVQQCRPRILAKEIVCERTGSGIEDR